MDETIVACRIHPGIGIARVGNSEAEYFVGPEVPGFAAVPSDGHKDAAGAIKRQAARFRVYGLNAAGEVVKEVTPADGVITWTVHVANKKAAWFRYATALDLPGAQPATLRNPNQSGAARDQLVIDPGPRSIAGRAAAGAGFQFDSGTFLGSPVYLGELRTDDCGRLLVLGGRGRSFSPLPANPATDFDDNDGWCDDVSDGPVTASVQIGQQTLAADPAWVIVAPPNFAPSIQTFVTMYDIVEQAFSDATAAAPGTASPAPLAPSPVVFGPSGTPPVSFTSDIYPIFERLVRLQWVNYGFFVEYGWRAPYNFLHAHILTRLADKSAATRQFRNTLFNKFRNPAYLTIQAEAIPPIYGDKMGIPGCQEGSCPSYWLTVTPLQYGKLQRWALGDFEADWDPSHAQPDDIEHVPPEDQPAALDRAALEWCSGGPFHPGCEAPWIMRQRALYRDFCRVKPQTGTQAAPPIGDTLTPGIALAPNGPIEGGLLPGDVTRWMAVPWQTDAASCRSGYVQTFDEYLPTFWPGRVPNHVLRESDYATVMNVALPLAERVAAFTNRPDWLRHVSRPNYQDALAVMLANWYKLGVLTVRPGPGDDPAFPPLILVESGSGFDDPPPDYAHASQWAHAIKRSL